MRFHGLTVQIQSNVGYDTRSKEVLKQDYMDDVMYVRYDMGMILFNLGKYFLERKTKLHTPCKNHFKHASFE